MAISENVQADAMECIGLQARKSLDRGAGTPTYSNACEQVSCL